MKEIYLRILEINLDANEENMEPASVSAMRNAIEELRNMPWP